MMEKTRVLFISQEIMPYLPESEISKIGRYLPQGIQEKKREIRVFMPRYGLVNERRHQLHEVIRLSGMNMIINDTDQSLIIKVASIQAARMQVYFIDNEDYFHRKAQFTDKQGNPFPDNDERTIFYTRGVLETIKKLRWSPDIIHCQGWFSGLAALFLKKIYKDDPIFSNSKLVYSLYNDGFENSLDANFIKKIKLSGITQKDVSVVKDPNYLNLNKLIINYADAVIYGNETVDADVKKYVEASKKPVLEYQNPDDYIQAYSDFYDKLLSNN